jgi:subtilase family serine protease
MEDLVLERSTPGNPLYQQWLSFDEVGDIIRNEEAFNKAKTWLTENGATVLWNSPHLTYIRATASIGTWEKVLHTEFMDWKNTETGEVVSRAKDYSLPHEMTQHIRFIFNTCQLPPKVYSYGVRKPLVGEGKENQGSLFKTDIVVHDKNLRVEGDHSIELEAFSSVTLTFLNTYYQIPSNQGLH